MAPGKELAARSYPHIKKVWKNFVHQRGVQQQQLSPFELNVAGGLFKAPLEKMKFKVADNLWMVGPPLVVWTLMIGYVKKLRQDYVMSHRH